MFTEPGGIMSARLRIAPGGTVAALMEVLEQFLEGRKSRDLLGLLGEIEKSTTWKTSPRTALVADYADLTTGFLKKAPALD